MIRLQPKIGLVFRLAVATLAMIWSTSASASLLIADNFVRVGPDEVVAAPFASPSTSTVNAYSGLVEIIASGTGFSLFSILNDAFYGVSSGSPLDTQYYQLNIGWTTAPLAPLSGEPRNIDNFIVFIEGIGPTTPTARPAFDAGNTYHFVVDTALLLPEMLQFGVSDGNFGDNGGSYSIEVHQVRAEAVPEPGTMALIVMAVAAMGSVRMRRRAR